MKQKHGNVCGHTHTHRHSIHTQTNHWIVIFIFTLHCTSPIFKIYSGHVLIVSGRYKRNRPVLASAPSSEPHWPCLDPVDTLMNIIVVAIINDRRVPWLHSAAYGGGDFIIFSISKLYILFYNDSSNVTKYSTLPVYMLKWLFSKVHGFNLRQHTCSSSNY